MRALILLMALLASTAEAQTPTPPLAIYAFGGQSNMTGCFNSTSPADATSSALELFSNAYTWSVAPIEPMDSAVGQIDAVSADNGVNPGTCFAAYSPMQSFGMSMLAAHPTERIGLVPCPRGGSFLAGTDGHPEFQTWAIPANTLDRTTLYGSCNYRMSLASARGMLSGFLFYQGEAEALFDPTLASLWGANFVTFITALRHDRSATLPICYAQIGLLTGATAPYQMTVRQQQADVCGVANPLTATARVCPLLANVGIVRVTDLATSDGTHLTTTSERVLGQRFAQCMDLVSVAIPTATPTPQPLTPTFVPTQAGFSCPNAPTPTPEGQ